LDGVLPRQLAHHLQPLYQYGMLLLLGAIFILPMLGIHVFSAFLVGTSQSLVQLLLFYGV
jgi:hypothetical protein